MDNAKRRLVDRKKRAARVRRAVVGTAARPRLCVRRSLKHISAQLVDDSAGRSLVQVTSAAKDVTAKVAAESTPNKSDLSRMVGELVAHKAKEMGIERIVFDRKEYPYHGRVKALADGARSAGLVF